MSVQSKLLGQSLPEGDPEPTPRQRRRPRRPLQPCLRCGLNLDRWAAICPQCGQGQTLEEDIAAAYAKETAKARALMKSDLRRQRSSGIVLGMISRSRGLVDPFCRPWQGLIVAYNAESAKKYQIPCIDDIFLGGPPFHLRCGHCISGLVECLLEPARLREAQDQALRIRGLLGIHDADELRDAVERLSL